MAQTSNSFLKEGASTPLFFVRTRILGLDNSIKNWLNGIVTSFRKDEAFEEKTQSRCNDSSNHYCRNMVCLF